MFKDKKPWLLAIPIVLVDLATFSNVFGAYRFFEHLIPALLVAIAFGILQIGSLILFSQNLPSATRRWLFFGVAILLGVTGISNIGLAYLRAAPTLPAANLVHVLGFGGNTSNLLVGASWLFGLALVICGGIYWSAYGQWLKTQQENRAREDQAHQDRLGEYSGIEEKEFASRLSLDGGNHNAR